MKHPQFLDEGWKCRALPMSGADAASMSATNSGRTEGVRLNEFFD